MANWISFANGFVLGSGRAHTRARVCKCETKHMRITFVVCTSSLRQPLKRCLLFLLPFLCQTVRYGANCTQHTVHRDIQNTNTGDKWVNCGSPHAISCRLFTCRFLRCLCLCVFVCLCMRRMVNGTGCNVSMWTIANRDTIENRIVYTVVVAFISYGGPNVTRS